MFLYAFTLHLETTVQATAAAIVVRSGPMGEKDPRRLAARPERECS